MLRRPVLPLLLCLLGTAACRAPVPADQVYADPVTDTAKPPPRQVLPGLEVLIRDSLHLVRGKRVGFLTNQTAVTSRGESGIDLLAAHPAVNLTVLFAPEHGVRGGIEGGVRIAGGTDPKTGIPVVSLYGTNTRPTPEMLRQVDVLLFDIQDVGARPYTYVWTMAMAMEVAAQVGVPFLVLDRPNPITGRVDGPLMQMEIKRERIGQPITGYYPVPLRHGMTAGEIALYVNEEFDVGANLKVIPASWWSSNRWFDEAQLPWVNPSPNIRSVGAALNYSGLVLFEATNVMVGRGTEAPFSYVGAPWLNTTALLQRLERYPLPGVQLLPTVVVPRGEGDVPYRGQRVQTLRLNVTDRAEFKPVWTALVLMTEIKRLHPQEFRVTDGPGLTQMLGSKWARAAFDAGTDPAEIFARWDAELREWMPTRNRYRLYATAGGVR